MNDATKLATHCATVLNLADAALCNEYGYKCLPLCVIDAVWSIGVRYGGVENVVARYRNHFSLNVEASIAAHSVGDLVLSMQAQGHEWFAEEVFQNRQRTSARNGLLKSEAVLLFASALQRHGMNTMDAIPKIAWHEQLADEMSKPYAQEILSIPGQRSGISLAYFYMLTGSEGIVKPDRMVKRFLVAALGRDLADEEAHREISNACRILQSDYPLITPRKLDHQIWKHQSNRPVRAL